MEKCTSNHKHISSIGLLCRAAVIRRLEHRSRNDSKINDCKQDDVALETHGMVAIKSLIGSESRACAGRPSAMEIDMLAFPIVTLKNS